MSKSKAWKQAQYKTGYRRGYRIEKAMPLNERKSKNEFFLRGYYEARRDRVDGEQPLF